MELRQEMQMAQRPRFISVTQVLKAMGFYESMDLAPAANQTVGKERGSALHKACHWLGQGKEPVWENPHPELDGFVDGYRAFTRDHQWEMHDHESEWINEDDQLIAHPDQHGLLDLSLTVIEIKTGALPTSVGLQTAGQLIARRWSSAQCKRIVLHLPGDGTYKLRPLTDWRDFTEFRSLLVACHVRAKHQGRWWEQ